MDYLYLSVKQLREELKKRNIKGYSNARKPDLIIALQRDDSGETVLDRIRRAYEPEKIWCVVVTRPNIESFTQFKTKKLAEEFIEVLNSLLPMCATLWHVPIHDKLPLCKLDGTIIVIGEN